MATRTAPRQARSAKSLGLILDAAERLLQQRGVDETSTVDVAAAAGVSVGRLYYWFPDKDAVVRAVLSRAEHQLRAALTESIATVGSRPAADTCTEVLPVIARFFRSHAGSLAVLQRGPVDGDDPGRGLCLVFEELMADLVDSCVPDIDGGERDLAASTLVRIIIAMLDPYVRATDRRGEVHLAELGYVVGAYLHCRFPDAVEPPRRAVDGTDGSVLASRR
jgi:AcrR family transcriptional regulator